MKSRIIVSILMLLSLLASLSGSAAAQGNLPPAILPPEMPIKPPIIPSGQENLQAVNAQDIMLGQPGTSFRYLQTFGIKGQPYQSDLFHINVPVAVTLDGSENLYVTEENGGRLLKYSTTDGSILLSIDIKGSLRDSIVDGDGNIWVAGKGGLFKYDASGHSQLSLSTGFMLPHGLAFDSTGKLYVSDFVLQDIKVFDIVDGAPIYHTTIGVEGEEGSDDGYFAYPEHIAIDSADHLYVVDGGNQRVQRCTNTGRAWNCVTFFGESGVWGSDLDHLGRSVTGLTVHGSSLYIADSNNQRVLKCTLDLPPTCMVFAGETNVSGADNAHLSFPSDVAVDSDGNVYVSEYQNFRVQEFDSSGTWLKTFGTTGVPYVSDKQLFNDPGGMTIGPDGSIYFIEKMGYRLIKLNGTGKELWTVGQAGVGGSDNAHIGQVGEGSWMGITSYPALDASGKIYVPDEYNNRIQIFDARSGAYLSTWRGGHGEGQFISPKGVAISPLNGDIYVVDRNINSVLVFDKNQNFKLKVGTGVGGSSNTQFSDPVSATVDQHGNLFVADRGNERIQKCTISGTSYTCSTFAGVPGETGSDYGHLSWWGPAQIAVDGSDRVYAADIYNYRVQVFDSAGAYLTTIGGQDWRANPDDVSTPEGIALDGKGNVYVSATGDATIQEYALGVPGWTQVNINGFGDPNNSIYALEAFNDQLYATTFNWNGSGGQIWQSPDAQNWTAVTPPGFGIPDPQINKAIPDLQTFKGRLYACTGWGVGGGELWRSNNGTDWEQVVKDGLGDSGSSLISMMIFNGLLYVGVGNNNGFQIWRSSSGDSGDWTNVITGGFDNPNYIGMTSWAIFNGDLYVAVYTSASGGMRILHSHNGADWNWASAPGFDDSNNYEGGGMAVFNGSLFVGTRNYTTGGQLWRSANGLTWTPVTGNGFGDTNNYKVNSLYVFGGALYAGVSNIVTGMEIWSSSDGKAWKQVNPDGFGTSNNISMNGSNSTTAFQYRLSYGIYNDLGGQVWQFNIPYYQPNMLEPQDGATPLSTRPTFTWKAIPVASNYSIQIGRDANFKSLVGTFSMTCTASGGTCSYTPASDLPANMTLYWHVKIQLSGVDNPWSEARSFHTPNPPSIPILLNPANNGLTTNYRPTLDWRDSSILSGAPSFDYYRLEVAGDASFSNPVLDVKITGITNSQFLPQTDFVSNTRFYWRVCSYNGAGQYSSWSNVYSFRTALPMPTNLVVDGSEQNLRPKFSWSMPVYPPPNAASFAVLISKNNTFTQIVNSGTCASTTMTPCSYTPTADLPRNQAPLYWRVSANGTNGPGGWSAFGSFTTGNPPNIPTLQQPSNGALTTNYQPVLDWSDSNVPHNTPPFAYYMLQLADNANFSNPAIYTSLISNFRPNSPLSSNTTFFWRVNACNANKECSGWSDVFMFRTPLLPPMLVLPVSGTQAGSYRPTFQWTSVNGASGYTIQLSGSSGGIRNYTVNGNANTTFTPSTNLPVGIVYWQVRSNGTNGPSAWSVQWMVIVP